MSSQLERELPNSIESERHLIGSLLSNPSLIDSCLRRLASYDFYLPSNQKVYAAITALYEASEELQPVAVKKLADDQSVTVSEMMKMIQEASFGLIGIESDVRRIVAASRRRQFLKFADRLHEMAFDSEPDELSSFAQSHLDQLVVKSSQRTAPRLSSEMVDDQASRYRLWFKGISNAIPTGFSDIDERLLGGGLVRSGLYVLAARPSAGKTSLALDIAANVASEGRLVHIVSREMPAELLLDRLHAAYAGIERWKLRSGIYERDYKRLVETLPGVTAMPIRFDNASIAVRDIRALFREYDRKHEKPELLIVDYIQMLTGKGRSRTEEVGSITRDLKGLAMEFDIPILALSQLSRDCEKQRREPELSDLRDSGEIEQDADAVFFLFGDKQEEGSRLYERWFKCAKQRDGALFRQQMLFNGGLVTFRSMEQLAIQGGVQ